MLILTRRLTCLINFILPLSPVLSQFLDYSGLILFQELVEALFTISNAPPKHPFIGLILTTFRSQNHSRSGVDHHSDQISSSAFTTVSVCSSPALPHWLRPMTLIQRMVIRLLKPLCVWKFTASRQ